MPNVACSSAVNLLRFPSYPFVMQPFRYSPVNASFYLLCRWKAATFCLLFGLLLSSGVRPAVAQRTSLSNTLFAYPGRPASILEKSMAVPPGGSTGDFPGGSSGGSSSGGPESVPALAT